MGIVRSSRKPNATEISTEYIFNMDAPTVSMDDFKGIMFDENICISIEFGNALLQVGRNDISARFFENCSVERAITV